MAQSPRKPRSGTPRRGPAPGRGDPAEGYLAGQVLIAMPSMNDPRFARTVVYLCLHSADGALGIVLNKPLDGLSFSDLLKQLNIDPAPPERKLPMYQGGPVDTGRGFVLHTTDWVQDASLRVNEQVALTASIDVLKEVARGGGPRRGILALGYAGWGPGQLDREIQQNSWLSVAADEALVFDPDSDSKWQRALAKLGVDPSLLSGAAGHA